MRFILSSILAFSFCRPCAALAQGSLMRAWVDPEAPDAVMGQFERGGPAKLFDTGLQSSDAFASGAAWKLSRFEQVALSPDGRRIAFKATGAGASVIGVFKVDSRSAQILDTSCDARALTWSPSGRYLVVQDAQGLLNNSLRLMAFDETASQIEISGDVLSDLGYSAYRFRNEGIDGGKDVWRTEVSEALWKSDNALSFKVRRVHLVHGKEPPPKQSGAPAVETWGFDLATRKFAKL